MKSLTLMELNNLSSKQAKDVFLQCCHSEWWAEIMTGSRPFKSIETVLEYAEMKWQDAKEKDILDAFSGHAQIGDLSGKSGAGPSELTTKEQGQVANAQASILSRLDQLNQSYYEKFGFIYIVFATGKSASEMLEILLSRIDNDRQQELQNGSIEQSKITNLRLKQLFEEEKS
ncbi:MAG: 2-oxo-4-hydroxy-4-carboxy-5-ureidoimidazoline decarboxylase [Acidiferrobacterales bacterium]|nr:2-oxo-4-hydroxy-4-carboxy-5-ureidoimidazoline decarboxylase [Acidiferrobacterales bacterium]